MVNIQDSPVYTGKLHKHLCLASKDGKRDDYFYVLFDSQVIARIYLKDRWYIWYEKRCYRTPVSSFTEAINLIEKEVMLCTA